MTLTVGTINVGRNGLPEALDRLAAAGAVVIGGCEMADQQDEPAPDGYRWWRPLPQSTYPNGAENPIAFRKDIDIEAKGSRWVADGLPTKDVPEGAAGKGVHSKRVNWLRFGWEDEQWFVTMSHTVPSLRYPVMDRLHKRHMFILGNMTERRRASCNVIHLGDLNCEWRHFNLVALRGLGVESNWQATTSPAGHSFPEQGRDIDHALYLPEQLTPTRQQLVESASDHNGLVVTFKVRQAAHR